MISSLTAAQYGLELKRLGLRAPAPVLTIADLKQMQDNVSFYRIGRRNLRNVFLLVRKGFATVYVNPSYRGYRRAYTTLFGTTLARRDVDHLLPRSRANQHCFIALGHIEAGINRMHQDTVVPGEMVMKGMSQDNTSIQYLTDTPRARELGRFVQNGYLRPLVDFNRSVLQRVCLEDFFGHV